MKTAKQSALRPLAGVSAQTRTVYRSERAGRSYMSLRAACAAEARAIIKAKYPSEDAEYDSGHITYPGFHWTSLPRQEVMLRRMTKLVLRAYKEKS